MLNNLTIQDFVIVDTLDLHFQEGMSVLSGETGAGKSILIDALSLCLGARADAAQVREGCERANITAIFSLNAKARNILEEQSISSNDDELHLRRAIDRNGRSKAYVNGTPVPLSLLKQLAETLIDIHGQHAFQTLTTIEEQMRLLDDFAQLEGPRQAVKNAYLELRKAEKQLASVQQNQEERNERLENLHWRLNLIQKINPQPSLWNQLNIDFDRLSHAAELIEGTQHAAEQLSDAEHAILDTLNAMIDKITHLSARDPNLATVCKHLSEGEIFLREASYELHHYLKHTELDPDALQQLEKQLSDWHETARTLRTPPEALHEELQRIKQDIQTLTTEFDITQLQADQQRAQETYEQNAKQLSQARQTAAQALSSKITASMQHLNMQGGSFSVDIRPSAPSPWGSDQIEFLVVGHPGVTPQAIQKVASGGELARISLAITINTVQNTTIPTLIFDEVDSGIGGAVAETVGKYLRSLAKNKQVLCVTHLPQVAAQGHHHFKVHKNIEHNHTQSSITALNPEQRIEEIARMLGGKTITAATRTTAQELLNGAH